MPDLRLKNLPEPIHAALKARAEQNRRSLNSEAIACLEAAVRTERIDEYAVDGASVLRLAAATSVPPTTANSSCSRKTWAWS